MGDILHALPAVSALRQMHPSWRIGWAIEPRWQALLTAHTGDRSPAQPLPAQPLPAQPLPAQPLPAQPLVDQVHRVPTKAWGRKPLNPATLHEILALRRDLRDAQYDAVLDLQGAIRSAVVARLSGCRRIIGEEEPRERPARLLYSERIPTTGAHVIQQDMELASAIAGDLLPPTAPLLPIDPAAEEWCAELPQVRAGKPLALINPGAGWGAKRWPAERYGAVAAALADSGVTVLVNAGPGEQSLAAAVVAASGNRAGPIVCTLSQLIALTRRIGLLIAGDTGPLHLACALGKPVVGIYGPTDPSRNGPYSAESAAPFRVLRSPASVRDHSRRAEPEAGLLTIQPQAVIASALELLPLAAKGNQPK